MGTPLAGDAMPMEDVTVETFSGARLVVIASSAPTPTEEVTVHLTTPDGLATHHATVVSSTPVSVAGTVRFKLDLRVDEGNGPRRGSRDPNKEAV